MADKYHRLLQRHLIRRGLWTHLGDLIIITIVGFIIGALLSNGETIESNIGEHLLYALILGGSLWKGSEFISVFIYSRINMLEHPTRLVLMNSIGIFAWIVFATIMVNYFWYIEYFNVTIEDFFASQGGWMLLYIEFSIAVIINLIFFAINFFKSWHFLNKNKRELERDKMALEFQTLRDQVNPHFLFNSLNTLSALVDIDTDKAQLFIAELSKVYRYVLDTQKDETIPLKEEMQFVDSFVYLNKLRLGDNLIVENHLETEGYVVIPLAVQMLVENAIKHNIASSQQTLKIDILKEGKCILVQNTFQPKESINEEKVSKSSRLGLENLKHRYNFISGKKVKIEQEDGLFKVYLPLIDRA